MTKIGILLFSTLLLTSNAKGEMTSSAIVNITVIVPERTVISKAGEDTVAVNNAAVLKKVRISETLIMFYPE